MTGLEIDRERPIKVYISGPMSGYEDLNFPAFNAAASALRDKGYEVENPALKGEVEGWEWEDYLRYDIRALMDCDAIYTLPGWYRSPGSQLEVAVATALRMKRMGAQ